jgi:hypothetical protein
MGIPVCDRPGYRSHDDRAQVAALATSALPSTITVKRAEWDATLATIVRLESRVGVLESRADEAERLARGVGPRVASLFRRDRLRGGR